jgi:hypothetical protein
MAADAAALLPAAARAPFEPITLGLPGPLLPGFAVSAGSSVEACKIQHMWTHVNRDSQALNSTIVYFLSWPDANRSTGAGELLFQLYRQHSLYAAYHMLGRRLCSEHSRWETGSWARCHHRHQRQHHP